jgi:multicomponent Na+:H+ antiporter subunit C
MTVVLAVAVGVLFATGTYLVLQRALTRITIGLALLGHGAVLLLMLAGGRPGAAPLGGASTSPSADAVLQALAVTAIAVSFCAVAFLVALARTSAALTGDDLVEDENAERGRRPQADGRPRDRRR